jgi:hypothetical protein
MAQAGKQTLRRWCMGCEPRAGARCCMEGQTALSRDNPTFQRRGVPGLHHHFSTSSRPSVQHAPLNPGCPASGTASCLAPQILLLVRAVLYQLAALLHTHTRTRLLPISHPAIHTCPAVYYSATMLHLQAVGAPLVGDRRAHTPVITTHPRRHPPAAHPRRHPPALHISLEGSAAAGNHDHGGVGEGVVRSRLGLLLCQRL